MFRKHLAIVELREKALHTRERARRARRVARLTKGSSGDAFKREAAALDAKAEELERQKEDLRSRLEIA
jgi:hypothetical protein